LGLHRDDLVGNNIRSLVSPRYQKYFNDYLERVLSNGKDEGLMQVLGKDGKTHILEYKNVLSLKSDGTRTIRGIARDVTDRLETEQALIESDVRFRIILDAIEDGYFEVDLNGCFTFFNNRIPEHLGYTHDEMMGMSYTKLMDEEQAAFVFKNFHDIFITGESVKCLEWELMKKDGTPIFVETSVSLRKNRKEEPVGFQGIIRDVTDRKRSEQELAYLAYHDPLTGLYNRKAFMEKLTDTIREAKRYENRRAVLYLDLDNFKKVNDVYGHEIGDKLLIEVAGRLKYILRDSDYISRFGGDEFTVILTNAKHLHAEKVAERIVDGLSKPYMLQGLKIDFISTSVGFSIFPDDEHDAQMLLKYADMAMYKAKELRSCYVRYNNVIPYPVKKRFGKKA
ncbi:sensor domain-containing diguanylate cyclase, partial [archaeon]|nr:sensor domain-containing diguanylate cyclase [archaeon]